MRGVDVPDGGFEVFMVAGVMRMCQAEDCRRKRAPEDLDFQVTFESYQEEDSSEMERKVPQVVLANHIASFSALLHATSLPLFGQHISQLTDFTQIHSLTSLLLLVK